MVGALLGSRGLHIFYEDFDYYREHPLDVFKVWQGGFVFYGGLLGAFLGLLIFTRIKKESTWKWLDFYAPVTALGYAIGRIGCFLTGCCYGRECDLPWAIEFTLPGLPPGLRHPTQLYATFWELGVLALLLFWENRKRLGKTVPKFLRPPGSVFVVWLMLHGLGRLIMELFRDDYRGAEPYGISISAWISMALVSISGTWLLFALQRARSKCHFSAAPPST